MNIKPTKIDFSIKLSDETTGKLKEKVHSLEIGQKEIENAPTTIDDIAGGSMIVSDETEERKIKFINEQACDLTKSDESKMEDEEPDIKCMSSCSDDNVTNNIEKTEIKDKPESENSVTYKGTSDDNLENIHYEGNEAIYTDPNSKQQYIWSKESNSWELRKQSESIGLNTEGSLKDNKLETSNQNDNNGKYGYEGNVHTYTDPDGSVYFWDQDKKAWFPKVDEEFLAYYQMSYGFVDHSENDTKLAPVPGSDTKGKEHSSTEITLKPKKAPEEPKWFDVSEDQNNKVYVSNLPLDITEEEFIEVMQKCGLVMKDPSSQKMKIKLYTKSNSKQLKGDGLCTYIKIESVELALNILDGYTVRGHRIKVQRAKFQMKGTFNPALKPKKKRRKDKEKLRKMQERLFDWRPEKLKGERSKHERIVIIKNLFDPSLFDKEVNLILEYQQDMREECSKCGEVKKVMLYDRHPEGVAQIIMKEPEEAENVVKLINGRWFGKRQLQAEIWDGKTKYKIEETDADLNKRLDDWNKFLDDDEDKNTSN